jgi:hypothetical protein
MTRRQGFFFTHWSSSFIYLFPNIFFKLKRIAFDNYFNKHGCTHARECMRNYFNLVFISSPVLCFGLHYIFSLCVCVIDWIVINGLFQAILYKCEVGYSSGWFYVQIDTELIFSGLVAALALVVHKQVYCR